MSRKEQAKDKYARMKRAIEIGRFEGEVNGPPLIGPLLGMIRRYCRETLAMFREDLSA